MTKKTIELIKEDVCVGCGGCENICPVNAISMNADSEGFLYPLINKDICIDCEKCYNICQAKTNPNLKEGKFYAAWQKNEEERRKSATAGLSALIAKTIVDEGGYFCGAAFIDGELKHQITQDFAFFDYYMRGSKYFQSKIGDTYSQIKKLLIQNKTVAFIGTPCQVEGLNLFLGKEYKKLLTIDLICHGVPSAKVFNKSIADNGLADIIKKDISFDFRNKKIGWHQPYFVVRNKDEVLYQKPSAEDTFCKVFANNLCLRKSCHNCKFSNTSRISDITVGDFWGAPKKIDDNKGINLISVNNKGQKFLTKIKSNLFLKAFNKKNVLQPQLQHPSLAHANRSMFFELLDNTNFNQLGDRMLDTSKNVAILNFHWENNNYGAVLTSYALSKQIKNFGYNPQNINYILNKKQADNKDFENFRSQYLPMTKEYKNNKDLEELNTFFDNFVVGSDQVWRYDAIGSARNIFFFDFVKSTKNIFSFAASFGENDFNATKEELFDTKLMLSKFSNISLREKEGVDIIKNRFNMKSKHVLDPVFLISKDEWSEIADKTNENNINDKVAHYAIDKENKEILTNQYNATDLRYGYTVEQWLNRVRSSDVIVTGSFHGMCFAIIFEKQFIVTNLKPKVISRIKSLLEMLDLGDRLLSEFSKESLDSLLKQKIDYKKVSQKLQGLRAESLDYLESALNNKTRENLFVLDTYIKQERKKLKRKVRIKYLQYKFLSLLGIKKHKKYTRVLKDLLRK